MIKAPEFVIRISGNQDIIMRKDSLNAESHGDGRAVSGKELKDGKLLTLTSEDRGDQLIFLFLLRSLMCSSAGNRYFPCCHALRVLNRGILKANREQA